MLRELQLSDTVPPWYSPAVPKPIFESPKAQGPSSLCSKWASKTEQSGCEIYRSWEEESSGGRNELPMDGEQRKEARREDHQVWPLHWELKQQFPGYDIRQYNIIIDVLGGWSTEVDEAMRELFGGSRRGDSTPDAESRHLAHPKHCPHTESDVLRIEQSELRHF